MNRPLAFSLSAVLAGCAPAPPAARTEATTTATYADSSCRVVLRGVGELDGASYVSGYRADVLPPPPTGRSHNDDDGDGPYLEWQGYFDVRADVASDAFIGYQSSCADREPAWTELPAVRRASQTLATSGYVRYDFKLDTNTARPGELDGTTWDRMTIQLIPFVDVAGEGRYYDHNGSDAATAANPSANYVLEQDRDDFSYRAPDSLCP